MDITYQTTSLLLIRTKNNYIGTRSVSKLERLSLIWTLCERCSRSNLQMNRRPLDVCFIFDSADYASIENMFGQSTWLTFGVTPRHRDERTIQHGQIETS